MSIAVVVHCEFCNDTFDPIYDRTLADVHELATAAGWERRTVVYVDNGEEWETVLDLCSDHAALPDADVVERYRGEPF